MIDKDKIIEYIKSIGYIRHPHSHSHSRNVYLYNKYDDSYINIMFEYDYFFNNGYIIFQHDNYKPSNIYKDTFYNDDDFYTFINKYHITEIRKNKLKKIGTIGTTV